MKHPLNLVLLWIAILVLFILQFIRVDPFIVWSSETYIGIFVSLMGIAVAVVIGYQAISANEVKNEIKELRQQNDIVRKETVEFRKNTLSEISCFKQKVIDCIQKIETRTQDLETHADRILASTQESVSILNALIFENKYNGDTSVFFYAFEEMHQALMFGLDYDSTNIDFILSKMRQYGSRIQTSSFGGGFAFDKEGPYFCNEPFKGKSLKDILNSHFLPPIRQVEEKIRNHSQFRSISHDYNVLMRQFYKRVETCGSRLYPKDNSENFEQFV